MYKHEITNENTLELLETVYEIYKGCRIANSYSSTISVAVEEFRGERRINERSLILCTSRKFLNGYLTFPFMRRWKESGRGLLVKDLACLEDYCFNDWKRSPEIVDYVEKRLVEAVPWGISNPPESKTMIVGEDVRIALLETKERFGLDTLDDALTVILNQTTAMRLVVFITRLIYDEATPKEAQELFWGFGPFYFVLAFERDDNYIKIVHNFFPYNYDYEFSKLLR